MNRLSIETLAAMSAPFLILGTERYALPVRFRVRSPVLECSVPVWSGVGDSLRESAEVTLVAADGFGPDLRWLFIRGVATLVRQPDWEGLALQDRYRIELEELYQVLRIEPTRIEWIDERRGWGFRETVDLSPRESKGPDQHKRE